MKLGFMFINHIGGIVDSSYSKFDWNYREVNGNCNVKSKVSSLVMISGFADVKLYIIKDGGTISNTRSCFRWFEKHGASHSPPFYHCLQFFFFFF